MGNSSRKQIQTLKDFKEEVNKAYAYAMENYDMPKTVLDIRQSGGWKNDVQLFDFCFKNFNEETFKGIRKDILKQYANVNR